MSTATRTRFTEFSIKGDRTIFAARFENNKKDHEDTKKLLRSAGLVMVRYQVLILGIDYNPDLKDFSEGNWGYVAGNGPIAGITPAKALEYTWEYTWDPKTGEIKELGDERDPGKIIRVLQGNSQLSLDVLSGYACDNGAVFHLCANGVPSEAAPLVFGIEPDSRSSALQTGVLNGASASKPVEIEISNVVGSTSPVAEAVSRPARADVQIRDAMDTEGIERFQALIRNVTRIGQIC